MITQTKSDLFPDPFDEPKRYWQKRKQLKAVGLDFDIEPEE